MISHIQNYITKHKIKKCLIGLSGGVDSVVLLHLLSQCENLEVRAIYVNHGVSKNALSWDVFCNNLCKSLGVDYNVANVDLNCDNLNNFESIARDARYSAYEQILLNNEALFLGHHSDDQVETVLLQLLRGTSVSGLSGMSSFSKYKNGFIARPFLELNSKQKCITKLDIENYAINNNIEHIFDESNLSNDYKRNFLRNEIIPQLKNKFGNINKTISKTADKCRESKESLNNYSKDLFIKTSTPDNKQLKIKYLNLHSDLDICHILRYWMINTLSQKALSSNSMKEITKFIKNYSKNSTGNFSLCWGEYTLKAKSGILYAVSTNILENEPSVFNFTLKSNTSLCFVENFFDVSIDSLKDISISSFKLDFLYLVNGKMQKLNKIGIPAWELINSPVFSLNEDVFMVGQTIVNKKIYNNSIKHTNISNNMY
jgi:tRNA(Ile)-lysidine synthase